MQLCEIRHYTDLLLRLASWNESQFGRGPAPTPERTWKPHVLAGPAPRFASDVMGVYHAKVRKLGKKIHKLDTVGLHRLRIQNQEVKVCVGIFRRLMAGSANEALSFRTQRLATGPGRIA